MDASFWIINNVCNFNRFDKSYEEAARDLGASPWKTFKRLFSLIAPSIIGIALFGFTLSLMN